MRTAENVLTVIRERGQRGLPLEDVYRQLYNSNLYLRAYGAICGNSGAMTPGNTPETVDGMSLRKIEKIIDDIRFERFRWTPVRRTSLPGQDGKPRPLGIPTWTDKLMQEVLRSLLEAYYEPQFSEHSHGFRPGRGCHTALTEIHRTWKGTKWFIQGDIRSCFDHISHPRLMAILAEQIKDNRFLRLITHLLQAGYFEHRVYHESLTGTPQGSILSPLLANIYLHRLDRWLEETLVPEHTRGAKRKVNPVYRSLHYRMGKARQAADWSLVKELEQSLHTLPYGTPDDPDYRRLRYVRYADDFLLGFAGPKEEAEAIADKIRAFLQEDLLLELSDKKSAVIHAGEESARFVGYEIRTQNEDTKRDKNNTRSVNGVMGLYIPADRLKELSARYLSGSIPKQLPELQNDSDFDIVTWYGTRWRGYVQWFLLAHNVRELNKLHWVMQSSLLKTLAWKHKSTVEREANRLRAKIQVDDTVLTCMEVRVERPDKAPLIARFGGIPLRRKEKAVVVDHLPYRPVRRTELIQRLLAERCEICHAEGVVEVHHIRKLADLAHPKDGRPMPEWARRMATRKRKTMVTCPACHDDIHAGRSLRWADQGQNQMPAGEPGDTETVMPGSVGG